MVVEIHRVDALAGSPTLDHDQQHAIAYGIAVEERDRLLRCAPDDQRHVYGMILTLDPSGHVSAVEPVSENAVTACLATVIHGLGLLPRGAHGYMVNAPITFRPPSPDQLQLHEPW